MGFTSGFLKDDSLIGNLEGQRCRLKLQLPWMRSLPLSSILSLTASVGSDWVAPQTTRLLVDGTEVQIEALAERSEEFWFPQQRLEFSCPTSEPVIPGRTYTVEVTASLRIPYLPGPPPANVLIVQQVANRQLVAVSEEG